MMQKVKRDAFIYLAPRPPEDEFAQCETCRLFVPEQLLKKGGGGRCMAFGDEFPVDPDASCGLYFGWPDGKIPGGDQQEHAKIIKKGLKQVVTPEETGYVDRQVRCENCGFMLQGDKCGLFIKLNERLPDTFELDPNIDPKGCCNGNVPIPTQWGGMSPSGSTAPK